MGCNCDWPGCAGQCHTGDSCPCHPTVDETLAALARRVASLEANVADHEQALGALREAAGMDS